MELAGERHPLVDATVPSAPRVYDYLLGGKDNFTADRDLADRLEAGAAGVPTVRDLAKVNRAFVLKAVQWSASMLGISQFLDLGCGLPSAPAVHDAAREGHKGARVVYVDRDPVAVCHVMHLQSGEGLAALEADVSDPGTVLSEPLVRRLIRFREPACVIFGATLSAMDADTARATVRGYAEALAPGSAVVISCASWADREAGQRIAAAAAGPWFNHGYEDVASFFAGLRIVHQRVMDVWCWPTCPVTPQETPGACVLGGIGVKS